MKLRLNGLNIRLKKNSVIIEDRFGDVSQEEVIMILSYLHEEGFLEGIKDVVCVLEKGRTSRLVKK